MNELGALPTSLESAADALATHDIVELTPNRDQSLAFRIMIPKHWLAAKVMKGVRRGPFMPSAIGFFEQPGETAAASIVVTMTPILVEVPVADWVDLRCRYEGWEVVSQAQRELPFGNRLDTVAVRGTGRDRKIRRIVSFVDNGRLFMVNAIVTATQWERLADPLWLTLATCELKAPTGQEYFERRRPCPGSLRFELPHSWTVESSSAAEAPASRTCGRLWDGDHFTAELTVHSTPCREPESIVANTMVERARVELRRCGFAPARRVDASAWPLCALADTDGWVGTFESEAAFAGTTVDIVYGFRRTEAAFLTYTLVTPKEQHNPLARLRGKRAFELAVMTTQA